MTQEQQNALAIGLTPDQVKDWLDTWGNQPKVQNYLATGLPEYGIIVHVQQTADIADDFLLYLPHDNNGGFNPANLHVTLVTGHPIVESVNKAPYVSPDDIGFWGQLQKQLGDVLAGAKTAGEFILVGLALLVLLQLTQK